MTFCRTARLRGGLMVLAFVMCAGGSWAAETVPDGPTAIRMLDDNLAQAPAGVLSPAAKRRVPALQSELQAFLDALRRETDDLNTL